MHLSRLTLQEACRQVELETRSICVARAKITAFAPFTITIDENNYSLPEFEYQFTPEQEKTLAMLALLQEYVTKKIMERVR